MHAAGAQVRVILKITSVGPNSIRDGEMSHRGSTIMSDVFRKTVKIFNIMSEIPYLPVTG
jgi:hypothetical protein